MTVFLKIKNQYHASELIVALPYSTIRFLVQSENVINVHHDTGSYIFINPETDTVPVPQVDILCVKYETVEECKKDLQGFYKALANNKNVFYFGGDASHK